MSWNPFNDIFEGVGNFFNGAYNSISSGIGSFFDMFESGSARRAEGRSDYELYLATQALQDQERQDRWARQFNESQAAFQQQQFENQTDLAKKPFTYLLEDARANGINPMAAMGQSVGSVSTGMVSPSGSSVTPPATPNSQDVRSGGLSSFLNLFGGLASSMINAKTQENTAKIQQETAESVARTNQDTQVEVANISNDTRKEELEETRGFHAAQVRKMETDAEVALRDARVKEGQLELAKQERLDELTERVARNAQRYQNMDDMYKQYQLKEKQLQEAIRANNLKLAGSILSSLCIIAASIIGGPVGGVAAAGISAWLAGGKAPAGFRVGD